MGNVMMNNIIFATHLVKVLDKAGIDAQKSKYVIYPIFEEGKHYSSTDDFVRLYVFPNKVSEKVFTFEDIVKRFSVVKPCYPLWVNVYVKEDNIVELHTCMRFRKPSLVFKNETGTEPFRLIESDKI